MFKPKDADAVRLHAAVADLPDLPSPEEPLDLPPGQDFGTRDPQGDIFQHDDLFHYFWSIVVRTGTIEQPQPSKLPQKGVRR